MPTTSDFINAIIAIGSFSNMKGERVSIESFRKEFIGTIEALIAQPNFEFPKNAIVTPYKDVLQKKDIKSVICFNNTWQKQNFFIETNKSEIAFWKINLENTNYNFIPLKLK